MDGYCTSKLIHLNVEEYSEHKGRKKETERGKKGLFDVACLLLFMKFRNLRVKKSSAKRMSETFLSYRNYGFTR